MGTSLICGFSTRSDGFGMVNSGVTKIGANVSTKRKSEMALWYWVAFICVMKKKKLIFARHFIHTFIWNQVHTHSTQTGARAKTHARIINNQLHASQTYLYYYLFFFFQLHMLHHTTVRSNTYNVSCIRQTCGYLKIKCMKNKHTMAAWISRRRMTNEQRKKCREDSGIERWRSSSCRH